MMDSGLRYLQKNQHKIVQKGGMEREESKHHQVTVVILGFYGSLQRHVDKYAKVWREQVGIEKVLTNADSGQMWMLYTLGLVDAFRIRKQIENDRYVVFHVLSNRGMYLYLELLRILPRTIQVVGVVFDSAPGALSPWLFFRAAAANQKDKLMQKMILSVPYIMIALLVWRYGVVRNLVTYILIELFEKVSTRYFHSRISKRDPSKCPSLFLYSRADTLVGYEYVEKVVKDREDNIGNVSSKRWEESAHVKHLYDFEIEYVQELINFAKKIEII